MLLTKRGTPYFALALLGGGLLTLAATLGGQHARGQPAPTVPIGATVYPPFGLALQPGDSIPVPGETPTPAPAATPASSEPPATSIRPQPGIPIPVARFNVQIVNDSNTQITVLGDGNNFTVTAYDGSIVQLRTTYAEQLPQGPIPVLSFCGPDDAQGNVVRCRGLSALRYNATRTNDLPIVLHVTTAPKGTTDQQTALAPGDTVFLVWPQAGATAGPGPAISVQNNADSSASIDWDGATLTATIPEGEALDGSIRNRPPSGGGGSLADAGCTNPNGPNSVACPLSGLPAADVELTSLSLAPSQPLQLPYADRYSDGTLTLTPSGPDPAPGGEAFSVSLIAGGTEFDGSGVLRPEAGRPNTFESLATLSDGGQSTWYVEGVLSNKSGVWAGRGAIVMANDPAGVASWNAGDAATAASLPIDYGGGAILAGRYGEPGLPLPALMNGALQPSVGPQGSGTAGQPTAFLVISGTPLASGPETFGIDFGDGTPPEESTQQEITHIFAAPGTYTLFSYIIDSTGQRTFGVSQIAIIAGS